jgi:DNA-binding NarL/FixJ family response regulator
VADVSPRHLCVLLANLEPVALVGMTDVLSGGGVDVVVGNGEAPEIVDRVRRIRPDALLLDRESQFALQIGRQAREVAPETKVILWPRDESEMEILDGASTEPRRVAVSPSRALLNELRNEGR